MLGDFNQQTLLHNTRERFAQDKIYSFIGMPILIAVNPYKKLNLYNDNIIKSYKNYFEKLNISKDDGIILLNYLEALALIGIEYHNNNKINELSYE